MSAEHESIELSDRLQTRRKRLETLLSETDHNAVWFARPNGFAWLTGGSNVVDRDSDLGIAAAGYTVDDGFVVLTDNIETQRLQDEELPAAFSVTSRKWYSQSLTEELIDRSPTPAYADIPLDNAGFTQLNAAALRQPLTESDREAYEKLGMAAARAVETIAKELRPGDTEHEVAAGLQISLSAQGINAPVVLVGGAERAQTYRHYTPTMDTLGDYALISVTAERGGLYASLTRTVAFDAPEWLFDRHDAATTVEVSALGATQRVAQENGTAAEVFGVIQDAYDVVGYPDEWKHHHQGGAAGYSGREWIATPSLTEQVYTPMAYAWNPTVQGAKSEGTVLVTNDEIRPLTQTDGWPTVDAASIDGETIVSRPAIYEREL
ncbi:M24 family metallopeptidase [Halorubraceae archaeon YAN]|nr:M24 family metallopeptidase [Halorubraceae archaeon YAN]